MTEPLVIAWADQFGALVRDKVRQMQDALVVTGWTTVAHVFEDPADGDRFRLTYHGGEFLLTNVSDVTQTQVVLDLESLGVAR